MDEGSALAEPSFASWKGLRSRGKAIRPGRSFFRVENTVIPVHSKKRPVSGNAAQGPFRVVDKRGMNLQSASALSARPNSSQPRQGTSVHRDLAPSLAASDTQAPELQSQRGRLGAAATRFEERLGELLESGELSREEAAAIRDAQAEFDGLVARLDNALSEGGFAQEGKLGRAFQFALDGLRQDVRDALGGDDGVEAATRIDATPDPEQLAARLSSAFERVDERLAGIVDQQGGVEARRLAGVQHEFSAVFARLEGAVAGGMNPDALGDLFQRMMDAVRSELGSPGDGPRLYDATTSITQLSGQAGQGRLDATA